MPPNLAFVDSDQWQCECPLLHSLVANRRWGNTVLQNVFARIKLIEKLLLPFVQGSMGVIITISISSVDLLRHCSEMNERASNSQYIKKISAANFFALNLSTCSSHFCGSESSSFALVSRPLRGLIEYLLNGLRPILIHVSA